MFFGDPDFMTIWQRSSGSVGSPIKCEAMVLLTWMAATPIHPTRLHSLENKRKPDPSLLTMETLPSFFFPSRPFLCRTHLSVFCLPPSHLRVLDSMVTGDIDVIRTSPIDHWPVPHFQNGGRPAHNQFVCCWGLIRHLQNRLLSLTLFWRCGVFSPKSKL